MFLKCTSTTTIARLAENLSDIPPLFPPLKLIVVEIASLCGLIDLLVRIWNHP